MSSKSFNLKQAGSCSALYKVGLFLVVPAQLMACGPFFPNNLLEGGERPVLVAPVINFTRELERMQLVSSRFQAVETDHDSYAQQNLDAESRDLRLALKRAKKPAEKVEQIMQAHQASRAKLNDFLLGRSRAPIPAQGEIAESPGPSAEDQPTFPGIEIPQGLPPEFADYLEGALAWHNPALLNKAMARDTWEQLLARPKEERHFKSTWAAFMLGRYWEQEDPDKAVEYYQRVRQLAREGFADSLGLAAASLGLEARIRLKDEKYEQAIELYLEQLATGDSSAAASLRIVANEALTAAPQTLAGLARNPRTQRVITAQLISCPAWYRSSDPDDSQPDAQANAPALTWLKVVEAADIHDVESAEKLALVAYQNNDMAGAQRWIKRAPNSPLGQWLQAKLLLRGGKLTEAARLLAQAVPAFPLELPGTNQVVDWREELYVTQYDLEPIPGGRQALGELGVLRLARREYVQALDALLNAGFWMDAAYVAERVLTLDELKHYVDAFWPGVLEEKRAGEETIEDSVRSNTTSNRERIRHLLARRLTRSLRGAEARAYYPAQWVPAFDALAQALTTGWNEALPAEQRAPALFQAAIITRTNGLDLIGTELAPDWAIHGGNFEEGVTHETRANAPGSAVSATEDELSRAARHNADPERRRFHYRYQAAALAWEAARLLPNNSDETAFMLWKGGCWLKNRDPQTADFFYKALVRRNRGTALGAEADRQRWFPQLDEQGNVIQSQRDTPGEVLPMEPAVEAIDMEPVETKVNEDETDGASLLEPAIEPGDQPLPSLSTGQGYEYIVRKGDSLAGITRAFQHDGVSTSIRAIRDANPGIDFFRIKIGQKIFIPASSE